MDAGTVRMSLYIPAGKQELNVVSRLEALAKKRDRSVNYVAVEAIMQYLAKEEKKA